MNNKGESDAGIILSILGFQAFLLLGLGFIDIQPTTQTIGAFSFTQNFINNISILGWGNALLFTPLIGVIIYIIAKLIRGSG